MTSKFPFPSLHNKFALFQCHDLHQPAPQHTLTEEPCTSPAHFDRNIEETPGFEGPTNIQDNSRIIQGEKSWW